MAYELKASYFFLGIIAGFIISAVLYGFKCSL